MNCEGYDGMVQAQQHRRNADGGRSSLAWVLAALVLFGVSFGYVEAAVVVYLRAIYDPLRQQLHPDKPEDELFPMITAEQLRGSGSTYVRLLITELGREAATLIVLTGVALAVARNVREWLASLVIIFGIWDIFYYVFLELLIDWPASLKTWDILFLLPVPWVGPVWSPVLVAAAMIVCGTILLRREWANRPVLFRRLHWVGIVAGGLILVLAFCWDHGNTTAGGEPNPFNWPLYAIGMIVGLATFIDAIRRPGGVTPPPAASHLREQLSAREDALS